MNRMQLSTELRPWLRVPSGTPGGHDNLRLYRLKEAEALTGIRVRRLKALIREGRLVGTLISKNDLRVSASDLIEFFNKCKTRTIL